MVVYAEDREQAYEHLAALEANVELDEGCSLSFHNFVNNADIVPRLLGGSMMGIHDRILKSTFLTLMAKHNVIYQAITVSPPISPN